MQNGTYISYEVDMNNLFEALQVCHNKSVTIMNTQILKEKSELSNTILTKYAISDGNKQLTINVKALLQAFSNLFQTSCIMIETSCAAGHSLLQYATKYSSTSTGNKPTYNKLKATIEELSCTDLIILFVSFIEFCLHSTAYPN